MSPVTNLGEACSVPGCKKPVWVGGVCSAHWRQVGGIHIDANDELEVMWAVSRLNTQEPDLGWPVLDEEP